jgi:hypothetical protein
VIISLRPHAQERKLGSTNSTFKSNLRSSYYANH